MHRRLVLIAILLTVALVGPERLGRAGSAFGEVATNAWNGVPSVTGRAAPAGNPA